VAHPDDEVLGCGGSIAKWSKSGEKVHVIIMAEGVTSRDPVRNRDSKKKELTDLREVAHSAGKLLGVTSLQLFQYPDNRLDSVDRLDLVKTVEKEIERIKPHTVVTHHSGDVNIDHRIIHDSVITACRPQPGHPVRCLLVYEVPSSTEWRPPGSASSFQPNWFEDISITLEKKMKALELYFTEIREWPHPRSLKAVEHLARWRGATVGCDAAEAFMLNRFIN